MEETTKVATIDEPIREEMFVTTHEIERLKMLPLRAQAIQHNHEVDPSANANLCLPQAQLPLLHVDDPLPPLWPLIGSFHTLMPVIPLLTLPLDSLRGTFRMCRIPF